MIPQLLAGTSGVLSNNMGSKLALYMRISGTKFIGRCRFAASLGHGQNPTLMEVRLGYCRKPPDDDAGERRNVTRKRHFPLTGTSTVGTVVLSYGHTEGASKLGA